MHIKCNKEQINIRQEKNIWQVSQNLNTKSTSGVSRDMLTCPPTTFIHMSFSALKYA